MLDTFVSPEWIEMQELPRAVTGLTRLLPVVAIVGLKLRSFEDFVVGVLVLDVVPGVLVCEGRVSGLKDVSIVIRHGFWSGFLAAR